MRHIELLAYTSILVCYQIGQIGAQIPAYQVRLKDFLRMQEGLGWPSEMLVEEGQEALMKLTASVTGMQSCTVLTPSGDLFEVASPPHKRFERWSDHCGVRVKEVSLSDTGRWRLSASGHNGSITGWSVVKVTEITPVYKAPPISLQDGEVQANVELTSIDNSYCLVAQPFSDSSLIPGHCAVTLERATRAVQGNWNVLIGVPGRVTELKVERQVAIEAERLDVGYIHDSNVNKIHLYCNILNTPRNITFCRFQKTTDTLGYNIMEGLSDGSHSYYGTGFVKKQCGMTIEKPTAADYGSWRCSVGSQRWAGNRLEQQTPMQALINVSPSQKSRAKRDAESDIEEERSVFVQIGLSFTITCRADASLSYCWFLHPNGTQFSPVAHESDNQLFWYSGESLQMGDCGITFSHANEDDAGDWACHMGATNRLGLELTDQVHVRVTGPLAANKKKLEVVVGERTTLFCHTANGNRPLDYCRFLSPKFVGISIDSSVTQDNAILDRFYFTPGRSLNHGDCSLTISSVLPEDLGVWTCAAVINDERVESSDTMELYVSSGIPRPALTQAGIAGMSIGIIALVTLLGVVVWHKIGRPVPWSRPPPPPEVIGDAFDLMSMSTPRRSAASSTSLSSSSETQSNFGPLQISRIEETEEGTVPGNPFAKDDRRNTRDNP